MIEEVLLTAKGTLGWGKYGLCFSLEELEVQTTNGILV